jgi:hypothetical protein
MGPSAARFVSQLQRGNRLKEWFAAVRESGSGTNLPISNVRFDGEYRGESGQHMLNASSSHFDAIPDMRPLATPSLGLLIILFQQHRPNSEHVPKIRIAIYSA